VSTRALWDDRLVGQTVLIVDDHAPFRRAARELLAAEGYEVVGEAVDGVSALAEAVRLAPSIVLLDVQLPDVDGFEVARRLAAAGHAGTTILVSGRAAGYGRRLAESPAAGFIHKGELTGAALAELLS
jgi:DNA-binding NarL/FixJ family response regulator